MADELKTWKEGDAMEFASIIAEAEDGFFGDIATALAAYGAAHARDYARTLKRTRSLILTGIAKGNVMIDVDMHGVEHRIAAAVAHFINTNQPGASHEPKYFSATYTPGDRHLVVEVR